MQNRKSLALALIVGLMLALPGAVALAAGPQTLVVPISKLPAPAVATSLDASLYDYTVFEMPLDALVEQVKTEGGLRLYLGNRELAVELHPVDLRADGYQAVILEGPGLKRFVPSVPVTTYAGHVVGDEASIVRMTISEDMFFGYILTEEEWLFLDPVRDFHRTGGTSLADIVVYRDEDVRPNPAHVCGTEGLHTFDTEIDMAKFDDGLQSLPANMTLSNIQIATEFDGQYFAAFGNPGSFTRIQGIINGVNGIYNSQLGLNLVITFQQGWSSIPGDPYTSLSASTSLNQFRNWWNANRGGTVRDIAHKWSGKNFSGGTIGIAWVGVVCNAPSLSYGISQDISGSANRNRLTAHEIGHNLSAGHDNQSPICPGVNCNGTGPIMCSFIQSSGTNTFSSCSLSSINNHVASNGFCLN